MDQQALIHAAAKREDIVGHTFEEVQWSELDLGGAIFRECTFIGARFSDTFLEDAAFSKCIFKACGFPRAKLSNAEFQDCVFFDSDSGKGVDFSYAELRDVRFIRCNLSSAKFRAADLFEARFEDCTAQGSNFEEATFTRTFGGSLQRTNTLVHMQKSNFDFALFKGISFEGSTLTDCSFREALLSGCDFTDCDLTGSDLSNAETERACFDRVDLRGTNLAGFRLGSLTSFDGLKIGEAQQADLLRGLGIQVFN